MERLVALDAVPKANQQALEIRMFVVDHASGAFRFSAFE